MNYDFKTIEQKWQQQWESSRIFEAQELLKDGALSLAEIAIATGFTEQSHFTRVFKEIVGVSPGIWQRQNRA